MNAVFDIKRFINLEKRNLLTHKNQFAYASLIILGYFVLSVLFTLITGIGQLFLLGIYPICFFVIVFAPGFFEKNIQKNNSIFDFILPGSTFEKFLIMIMNYAVLIPILCFSIVFLLVQLTGILPFEMAKDIEDSLSFSNKVSWGTFLHILVFQSFFLTGYMYFKRFSFIKTLLIIIGAIILFQIAYLIIGIITFKDIQEFNQMSQQMVFIDTDGIESLESIKTPKKIIKTILYICFPFGLWIVSFLKLREKEI